MSKETCKSFEEMKTADHNPDVTYVRQLFTETGKAIFGLPERKNEGRFKVTKEKFYH